jgi:CRP/FNR family transcriptional regulator, dissimilatory nitrate respiration regulator
VPSGDARDARDALIALPVLGDLSPRVARRVAAAAVIKRYPRRAVLFRAGEAPAALHIVLEGRVRVARRADTGSTVLHFEESGGVLGEIPVFGGGAYPATASAAAAACCAVLSARVVERLLAEEPEFARFALRRIARRARVVLDRLDQLSDYSVTARVAGYLSVRADVAQRQELDLGMSQAALAEQLGTAREVVVRSLRALCDAGVVLRVGRSRFAVVDARRLRELALPRA